MRRRSLPERAARYAGEETAKHVFKQVLRAASTAAWPLAAAFLDRIWTAAPTWLLWTSAAVGVVGTASYAYRDQLGSVIGSIAYRWKVSTLSGISRVYPVQPYGEADPTRARIHERLDAEASLKGLIAENSRVDLLLASGWRYVGCSRFKGILYGELDAKRAGDQVRFLLLDPAVAEARAREQKIDPDRYRQGMQAVLFTLAGWRRQHGVDILSVFRSMGPLGPDFFRS